MAKYARIVLMWLFCAAAATLVQSIALPNGAILSTSTNKPHKPTKARMVPIKLKPGQLLGYECFPIEAKLAYV